MVWIIRYRYGTKGEDIPPTTWVCSGSEGVILVSEGNYEITEKGQKWLDNFDTKYHLQSVEWSRLGIPSSLKAPKKKVSTYWLLSDILQYGRLTGSVSTTRLRLLSQLFRQGLIEEADRPRKFYHATLSSNIPIILEEGLRPSKFKSGLTKKIPPKKLLGGKRTGVYLEPALGKWAGKRGGEIPVQVGYYGTILEERDKFGLNPKREVTILEVKLPADIIIVRDPGLPGGAKALGTIPPDSIKVLKVKPEELR